MKEFVEIPEEMRNELGNFIEKLRIEKNIGFNQLAIKIGMNVRTLNEIINGKMKRIIPFHLQKIAYGLKIDYKELYKIVGYLDEEDFSENSLLRKENEELKEKLFQCQGISNVNNGDVSNQVVGNVSNSKLSQCFGVDFEGLSEEEIKMIASYTEFLKAKRENY